MKGNKKGLFMYTNNTGKVKEIMDLLLTRSGVPLEKDLEVSLTGLSLGWP